MAKLHSNQSVMCHCKECKFCGFWSEHYYENNNEVICTDCGNSNTFCPVCNIPIRPKNPVREAERHEKCIAIMQLSQLGNQFTQINYDMRNW